MNIKPFFRNAKSYVWEGINGVMNGNDELAGGMTLMPTYRRTRIAPTPSGFLHAGNIMSFVVTAGLARRHGASILLRIDDLDIGRVRPAYIEDIFETLSFLGIPWDEGPRNPEDFHRHWSQRLRLNKYELLLHALRTSGHLFGCDCTRTKMSGGDRCVCAERALDLSEPGITWRFLTETHNRIIHRDLNKGAVFEPLPTSVQYPILRKRDGDPAYHVASVSDDVDHGVDLIVRGLDLLDTTLLQSQLASFAGLDSFSRVTFCHHPLIMDTSGRKLSKSAGDGSVSDLRKAGAHRRDVFERICASCGIGERPDRWEDLFEMVAPQIGISL
jgi:glutamyl-tRNA synthetase